MPRNRKPLTGRPRKRRGHSPLRGFRDRGAYSDSPSWLEVSLAMNLVIWPVIGVGWCIWKAGAWIWSLFQSLP